MIFKKLFTKNNNKKWQSDKESERLQAISELEPSVTAQKNTLHELAFNDSVPNVRWQALTKLNEFSLFWQAYKQDSDSVLVKKAQKSLAQFIISADSSLTTKEKVAFVEQSAPPSLLQDWVSEVGDENLLEAMLKKINKPSTVVNILLNRSISNELALNLINQIDDVKLIKKLAKSRNTVVSEQAAQKLVTLKAAQERPGFIEQESRLLLAQLKALKETTSYTDFSQKKRTIINNYRVLEQEFDVLKDSIKAEITTKFDTITSLLANHEQTLSAAFEAEQQALALQDAQKKSIEQTENIITRLNQSLLEQTQQITNRIQDEPSDLAVNDLGSKSTPLFLEAKNELEQISSLTKDKSIEVTSRLTHLETAWLGFIDQVNVLVKAQVLINEVTDTEESAAGWLAKINELRALDKKCSANVFLKTSFNQLIPTDYKNWQSRAKELNREQEQTGRFISNKLNEVVRLIEQGRFNSALGLFSKLQRNYDGLTSERQSKLSRRWDEVTSKISKVQSLQADINEPKIEELISAAQSLAEKPLIDLSEQAYRVKVIRKNWNSLRLDSQAYDEQNKQFDAIIEILFSP